MRRIIYIIFVLLLAFSLCGCSIINNIKVYKAAEELYAAGKFEEAVDIYETLGEYKDSADKALVCRYDVACTTFEGEDYKKAQELFEALGDYKDSADMAEKCRREVGMRENADYSFLADMETMTNAKIYCEPFDWFAEHGHGGYESFTAEQDFLEKYEEAIFYDQELHELAKMYIDGIEKQKASVSASDPDTMRSREVEGAYLKYTALVRLHEEYDFMKDNEPYSIFRHPEHEKIADACKAYPAVYDDLTAQLDAANLYTSVDETTGILSLTVVNNTAHAYSAYVSLLPRDVREAQIAMPVDLLIENLAPGESIELSATIEDADSFWSYEYDVFFTDIDGMSPYFWY